MERSRVLPAGWYVCDCCWFCVVCERVLYTLDDLHLLWGIFCVFLLFVDERNPFLTFEYCFGSTGSASNSSSLKRLRDTSDLQATIDEQKAVIESLQNDKSVIETSFQELKTTHEKTLKENQILRKAVSIQQDKQTNLEGQLRQQDADYQAKIKNLENVILSLKYHLSASNSSDFASFRPPPGGDWCH